MEMDVEDFKRQFLPCHPKLYRIAFAFLENRADAEDMVQEAYGKLWNKRNELPDLRNPEAFAVTLIRNLCLDYLRTPKMARSAQEIEQLNLQADAVSDEELARSEELRLIAKLIDRLPHNQRQVIRLRGIEACSLEEIEAITGLSSSNIRTLLCRARKTIRQQFEKLNGYG